MSATDDRPFPVSALAAAQWGMVTVPQLARAGVAGAAVERALAAGRVAWVIPGQVVYVQGAVLPTNPRLTAVWLLTEETPAAHRRPPNCAVACRRSALKLYGLPGLSGPQHEFTGSAAALRAADGVLIHPDELAQGDWRMVDGIPVTTPVRTFRDFAASPDVDGHELARIGERFVRHGLATSDELAAWQRRPRGLPR